MTDLCENCKASLAVLEEKYKDALEKLNSQTGKSEQTLTLVELLTLLNAIEVIKA